MTLQSQCRGVPFRPCSARCARDAWDGLKKCPACRAGGRRYYEKNREKGLEYAREYREKNREELLERKARRRSVLRAQGLCGECGQRSTLVLSFFCEECKIRYTINKDRRALASV